MRGTLASDRAGISLVELLLAISLGGLLTAAAISTMAPTNELARQTIASTESEDGARTTVYVLAANLRRVPGGGVLVATADSVVVAMPLGVGAFCAATSTRFTAYLGIGGARLDSALVDGYALRNNTGAWTFTALSGGQIFADMTQDRSACASSGGGQAGTESDYYALRYHNTFSVGAGVLVWERQTYRFGPSVLMPSTRAFFQGPTGANQVEIAYGLHQQSGFRYRLRGTTTWLSAVASTSVAEVDAVRVVTGTDGGGVPDMQRDVPLINTE